VGDEQLDRRGFLRLAAAGAVCATVGAGCSSGSGGGGKAKAAAASKVTTPGPKQLRIVQAAHFVPGYDASARAGVTNIVGEVTLGPWREAGRGS